MKIDEFIRHKEQFLLHIDVERNLSKHTVNAYTTDFEQMVAFWQSTPLLKEASLNQVLDRFFIHLFHKKVSSPSIARKISSFKSFEKFVEKKGIALDLQLARPRIEKKLPVYLSVDEMFKLLDTDDYDLPTKYPLRDKAILEILYATGIRCTELVHIRMCDIRFDQKTILVRGKGNKERLVLFHETTKEKILAYMNVERNYVYNYNEYLFVNSNNEQLSTRTIQRIVKMFRSFLSIEKKITPHKIRHTFATHLLNQGADIRVLQELLGHKSLASTEKYTHVTTTQLKEVCNTLHPIHTMKKKHGSSGKDTQNDQ